MSALRASLQVLRLPLRSPLRTAHARLRVREGFLLKLEDDAGGVGWGEALPLPDFGGETHAACESALRAAIAALGAAGPGAAAPAAQAADLPPLGEAHEARLAGAPVARNALSTAWLDLCARRRGVMLATLLGAGPAAPRRLEVNALIGADAPAAVAAAARAARERGFGSLKLKIGARPLEVDLARARALRAAAGGDARLRFDANGAFGEAQARSALAALAPLRPEFVEQPVAPTDGAALARLRGTAGVPIAADESVRDEAAARALLEQGAVDVLVLKLPVLGGPRAALRIARAAAQRGTGVVFTSLLDSSLGIAAAAHTACAAPGPRAACGLATAELLARDVVARPLRIEAGHLHLPPGAGLGIAPDPRDRPDPPDLRDAADAPAARPRSPRACRERT